MDLLKSFNEIQIESPVDKIIQQIRDSIVAGKIRQGDRLPSERKLSELFGVGRTYVRDALKKLEFYGVLKTHPQSGTVVNGIDTTALEGLISNIIQLSDNDFFHLVETRVVIESFTCYQAALRRSSKDLDELIEALEVYRQKVDQDQPGVKEDFGFHLKIAEASQNLVMKSLLMTILPDIIEIYRKLNVCGEGRFHKSYDEHKDILYCIANRDAEGAKEAMNVHLKDVYKFSLTRKK